MQSPSYVLDTSNYFVVHRNLMQPQLFNAQHTGGEHVPFVRPNLEYIEVRFSALDSGLMRVLSYSFAIKFFSCLK